MQFVRPEALYLLAALAVVAALYLARLGGPKREVAAIRFWREAFARRGLWTKLRRWVSLLLALVILTVIVLAAAEPFLPSQVAAGRSVAIVIDRSASMSATDTTPYRLARAIALARQEILSLGAYDKAAIFGMAGSSVHVAQPWTGDVEKLLAATMKIQPTAIPGDATAAAEIWETAKHKPNAEMVVIGDMPLAAKQKETTDRVRFVSAVPPDAEPANTAITNLTARRRCGSQATIDLAVTVQRWSPDNPEHVIGDMPRVEVRVGDDRIEIPLNEKVGDAFRGVGRLPFDALPEPTVKAALTQQDDLFLDDSLSVVVPGAGASRVVFVGSKKSPVLAALAAVPHLEIERNETWEGVASPSKERKAAAIIAHAPLPPETPERPFLLVVRQEESIPGAWRKFDEITVVDTLIGTDVDLRGSVIVAEPIEGGDVADRNLLPRLVSEWVGRHVFVEQPLVVAKQPIAGDSGLPVPPARATETVHRPPTAAIADLEIHRWPALWVALVAVAVALLVVEWVLSRRRITV